MSIADYNGSGLVAIKGKNCIGIAADTRLGLKFQTIDTQFRKVFVMQNNIIMGLGGLATDIQTFYKLMKYKLKMYQLRENRQMKAKTFTNLVASTLYEHRFGPYFVSPIVVGLDDGQPVLCDYDSIGHPSNTEDFAFGGTSGDHFMGVLEAYYKENIEADEMHDILSNVLVSGLDNDILAGWGGVVYVMTPTEIRAKYIKTKMI